MPQRINRLHPLLSHLTDPAAVLDVSPEQVSRALRIMHVVFAEAERRGYEVAWAQDTSVGAEIRVGGLRLHVTLSEEWTTRSVVPTLAEVSRKKVYDWQRFQPETRSVRSGKFRLEVSTATGGVRWERPAWWADRQRWSVEDKMGEVLAEITSRIQAEQDRIAAEERARLQRQRDWESAMVIARARFEEERRITCLTEQLESWQLAASIRAYCAAVEQARPPGPETEELEAQARWLDWCRSYADRIDPTCTDVGAPEHVDPTPADLEPYLHGFSPYGP